MIAEPHIERFEGTRTAVIRLTVPRERIREVMGPGLRELMAAIAAQGVAPSGAWLTHHFRMDPAVFDFQIAVPVEVAVAPAGRVTAGRLPAATVARTVYRGPYEGLPAAWGEFGAWLNAHGHATGPDLWESYVAGPESSPDPTTWRTELNRPVVSP